MGLRRGSEVVDLIRGDASTAVFSLTVEVVTDHAGNLDFRGPFVHGKRGERCLYLRWGEVSTDGRFDLFRAAKLHLSAIPESDVVLALDAGACVEATLDLTDACGGPICASVQPPKISWRVGGPMARSGRGLPDPRRACQPS